MRIAIFTEVFLPKIDGITNRLRHTIRHLRERGHEVLVFAPRTAVQEYAGARVVRVPGLPFPAYPGLAVTLPDPRLVPELMRFDPHVVHAVGPACLGVWGVMAARTLGLPLVASYHTDLPRYLPRHGLGWAQGLIWPLLRRVHNAAHVNLCPSRFTRDELRARDIQNVSLWTGGVDTKRFHPAKATLEMRLRLAGDRPDGPVILCVARLSPEKNLGMLRTVLDQVPEARLAIVGDGPARSQLEDHFDGRRVTFMGFLRGAKLAAAFASADVFVMPSTTETLGFVVLEAMSSGLPVVAASAGGLTDLVRHGQNGLLFDPERPEQAASQVREVLEHPQQRSFLVQQARKTAERHSWERETRKLEDHYRAAVVLAMRRGFMSRARRILRG